ncbi:MAG: glycosyltransferase family 4 protein [candidate division KSB1 bacterium]|nr:glycosyltransferase family 4 protein [candidate division KSB1 bacterium]MDZ7319913.1 glycosyltransferase family 4 protein [candidate division KSB1 bacterium]MDZ7342465.1 glycosyltransferase family 4 protein [candidate division KSB1 bacterium]
MRILMIWTNLFVVPDDGSGARSHNTFLKNAFEQLGHETLLLSPVGNGSTDDPTLKRKQSLYGLLKGRMPRLITDWLRDFYSIWFDLRYDQVIETTIAHFRPDFIYERFTDYHSSGLRAAFKANVPYLTEIHAPLDSKKFYQRINFRRYNRRVLMKVANQARSVIVVSQAMKRFLLERGVPGDKIFVLHNAVDPALFRQQGLAATVKQRLGIDNRRIVGFVGTMKPYHGLDLLPDVCNHLRSQFPDICFLMVGRFKTKEQQTDYIQKLNQRGLAQYFVFTGGVPVEQVPPYIEAMDICLMPDSNDYGSPIKLFEYGALAKPVVMPDYAPIAEIVHDGQNGLLFAPRSASTMAAKIALLLNDSALRQRIGHNLYQDVLSHHTWQHNASTIIQQAANGLPVHRSLAECQASSHSIMAGTV